MLLSCSRAHATQVRTRLRSRLPSWKDRPAWPRPSAWARILVLTKPIHVEQSKGTLRVARGLLRKGQAAKPVVAGTPSATSTLLPQPSVPAPFLPPQSFATPSSPALQLLCWTRNLHPSLTLWTRRLLEYMPDSPRAGSESSPLVAAESDPSKQYPWQPRKPMAEPMASALRRAAEAAGKSEFDAAAPRPRPRFRALIHKLASPWKDGRCCCPCPCQGNSGARCQDLDLEPTGSAISAPTTSADSKKHPKNEEVKQIEDPSASADFGSNSALEASEAPSFTSLDGQQQASGAGGSKKTLLIAVVVVGLAAAAYFGWTKMQSAISSQRCSNPQLPPLREWLHCLLSLQFQIRNPRPTRLCLNSRKRT